MAPFNIDALVEDLQPVRRLRPGEAVFGVVAATVCAVLAVTIIFGLRADILAGTPDPLVVLRGGMLLVLGSASLAAIVAAARPQVGQSQNGWRWALAAASLFPATSIVLAVIARRYPAEVLQADSGPWCLAISVSSALAIGGALTLWLRRGAVARLNLAGSLVGLTAGSFGTFAYSLHCPSETVHYIGLWYTLAIGACVGLGRLIVPRLIRW